MRKRVIVHQQEKYKTWVMCRKRHADASCADEDKTRLAHPLNVSCSPAGPRLTPYEHAGVLCWPQAYLSPLPTQGLRTAISGGPINIKVDNSGCIDFSKNPVEHKRTKHIDIRYHFVREAITTDKVTLEHCATDDMVADPMTKELGMTKHDKHVEAMGLC